MQNDSSWNLQNQEAPDKEKVRKNRLLISTVFGFIGSAIIFSQIFPISRSFLEGKIYEIRASILANPIPNSHKEYIQGTFAYYNPGLSYFQNLISQTGTLSQNGIQTYDPATKQLKYVEIDEYYSGNLDISIKSAGINSIKVSPNVESSDENIYNKFLKFGVAHFKGTPVPGDGGNSFIYGHSAVPSFFNNHKELPETIFSNLEKVDVGDTVIVKRDGNELEYIVRNKKIIEPNDYTVLKSNSEKEIVTLMTCWPLGIPSKRLIVTAERV